MSSAGKESTTDKIKDKLNMGSGKKDYSKQARADRKKHRRDAGQGSDTSSSSEDEGGRRYDEEERQRRKKEHAERREMRARAKREQKGEIRQ